MKGQTVFEPVPTEVGHRYVYQPLIMETCGPGVPELEELESYGCVYSIIMSN